MRQLRQPCLSVASIASTTWVERILDCCRIAGSQPSEPYASASQSAALLRSGAQYRRDRMEAADMITTDEVARLAGTSCVTINAWIKAGRCIGVSNLGRGFKLPR